MPICPNCRGVTLEGDVCQYCGVPFEKAPETPDQSVNITINNYAGSEAFIPTDIPVQQQPQVAAGGSLKSWTVSLILAFFLGMFGAHRFYTGKTGTGLIWLFTGGCFLIGWVVDIYTILYDRFSDNLGRPILCPENWRQYRTTLAIVITVVLAVVIIVAGISAAVSN